jgi:ribosomal protein S21
MIKIMKDKLNWMKILKEIRKYEKYEKCEVLLKRTKEWSWWELNL